MARAHRLLRFERDAPRLPAYASLYRFGARDGPAPLIVYVGGSLSRTKYLERMGTEPTAIVDELEKALLNLPLAPLDLLVCPCPVQSGEDGLDAFVDHYDRELSPALGGPPSALACVGYSAGALLAGYLGIVAEARGIATVGGSGLLHAASATKDLLQDWQRTGDRALDVGIFKNEGDQVASPLDVARALPRPLRARVQGSRPGGHRFRDYVANGSVADAFRFLLERLR